jgi:hypothetical protein
MIYGPGARLVTAIRRAWGPAGGRTVMLRERMTWELAPGLTMKSTAPSAASTEP